MVFRDIYYICMQMCICVHTDIFLCISVYVLSFTVYVENEFNWALWDIQLVTINLTNLPRIPVSILTI
jgi:hypothetical protein